MIELNRNTSKAIPLPIKIVQFGEGNFLRAFVDSIVHSLNEKADYRSGIVVIQPIEKGMVDLLEEQDCLYHHVMQGVESGVMVDEAHLISSIQSAINPFSDTLTFYHMAGSKIVKLIFSNTTEAGISFDKNDFPNGSLAYTFPGKLVQFLKKRFDELGNTKDSEIGIIPCELIEANGDKLSACIEQYIQLWGLGEDFQSWVKERVHFANTLVDRIVPGYPGEEIDVIKERIGFDDKMVVKSESFHLFVIEGDEFIREHFPAHKHGFNVKYVDSIVPFRTQKVRILNGAHTSMVPVGMLCGLETVSETIDNKLTGQFVRESIFNEIVTTIHIPGEDPKEFAEQVISRFQNPFIRHELASISLNSIAKWKVRVLPTVLDYLDLKRELPKRLTFSLVCLIQLYLSDLIQLKDEDSVLTFFNKLKTEKNVKVIVDRVLKNEAFWDKDLRTVPDLSEIMIEYLSSIRSSSVRETLTNL